MNKVLHFRNNSAGLDSQGNPSERKLGIHYSQSTPSYAFLLNYINRSGTPIATGRVRFRFVIYY